MEITNFNLEKWYVEYEFKSKYNLSASGIKPLNLNQIINNITDLNDTVLTYSPAQGNESLIEVIAKQNNVDKSKVLITNGAIEALFLTQISLFNKNDNIIVVKPTYPALYQIAEDIGANIIDWDLDFNKEFEPDLNTLETLIQKHNPKAVIINFPNNPTGSNLNKEQKKQIIDICKNNNCYLISDEVYSHLDTLKNTTYEEYNKKITIDSLSKTYGLAGVRIGWVIAEKDLITKMMNLRHYTTLCNNVISEKIALYILNNSESYISENLNLLQKNRDLTFKYLDEIKNSGKIDYIKPKSGLMIFVKLNINQDAELFCKNFEEKTSILLLPGNKYSSKYKDFFRLGFGINTETLEYCLKELKKYLLEEV